jgi:hypothetical protein
LHRTGELIFAHLLETVSGSLAEEIKKARGWEPDQKSSSTLAGRQLREHLPVIHHGMSTTPIKADLFQPLQPVMPCNVEQ